MKKIKYRISLDMLEVASQTTIKVKKGDTACSILITLTENGKIYHISEGCRAVFSAKKADGNYLFNSETCSIVDNTIVYDFTKQTVTCEGIAECEVILYKGEEKLTSPRFDMLVDNTVYNGEEIISSPEADALDKLIDEANELITEVETKLENGDFVGEKGDKGDKGEDGVGRTTTDGGEIFNDYETNKALSKHTSVRGSGNQAGSKGFRVLSSEFFTETENLIPFPYAETSKTINGVTFTINDDKSITVNGKVTGLEYGWLTFTLWDNVTLDEGTYKLSGCPSGGDFYGGYSLSWDSTRAYDEGSGTTLDYYQIADFNSTIYISLLAGTYCNKLTFRPKLEKVGAEPKPKVKCKLEESANGLETGDITSLRLNYNHLDVGAITSIEDKTVVVTLDGGADDYVASQFHLKSAEAQAECPWYNTLSVNAKPDVGIIDIGMYASADGLDNFANRIAARASGEGNKIVADYGSADGQYNTVGYGSHSSGRDNKILGEYCEGNGQSNYITKNARYTHIDGYGNKVTNTGSESPNDTGNTTRLDANYIGGFGNVLKGFANFVSGMGNKVISKLSFVSGQGNEITAPLGRAGGLKNKVTGDIGDAYGNETVAGNTAVSRGYKTKALGWLSAAFGYETRANNNSQFVLGQFNSNKGDTYLEVGNGSSDTSRSNAFEVKKNGTIVVGGVALTPTQLQQLLSLLK